LEISYCVDRITSILCLRHVYNTITCICFTLQVDFDKTKHLSDKAIRKRRLERERLEQLEKEREERVRREREEQDRKVAEEK
jgi:hypothetical protein